MKAVVLEAAIRAIRIAAERSRDLLEEEDPMAWALFEGIRRKCELALDQIDGMEL